MLKYCLLTAISFFVMLGCSSAQDNVENKKLESINASVIQKLLDESNLNKYFHVDTFPERSPLIIVINEFVDKGMVLHKFNRPVILLEKKRAIEIDAAYLEISSIAIEAEKRIIKFNYPPEGIKGTAVFNKTNHDWKLIEQEIIEM